MYGLRSGRLLDSTSVPQNDFPGHTTSTEDSQPPQLTSIKTEPTYYSQPLTQSPYFTGNHRGMFGHSTSGAGGGGLEDIEDFSFDAGYVISSKLSEMVANGAYSYPSPPANHAPPHTSHIAHSCPRDYIKTEPGASHDPHPPPNAYQHIKIKTEPSAESTPPLVTVKQEPSTFPCTETAPTATPSIRVKGEPGGIRVKGEPGGIDEEKWEPPLWRVQYRNICQMRSERTAPVDTHGCFMLAQKDVPAHVRRYQVLVSLMLSSQTKDQITGKAMTNLKKHGLTVENVLNTPREDIAKMINMVGFWQKKSDYIKRTTELVANKYNGDIPTTLKDLMSLPGVGPKMANLVMDFAWGKVTGIAVDTHVHRISHRLGWMKKQTPSPEATRLALEKWLPMSEWSNLNLMMVGFGQTLCSPQRPHCEECLNRNLCPSSLACNDSSMGGLAGHYTPTALTTGKKKKGKTTTPVKREPPEATPILAGVPSPSEEATTSAKKKRKLNKSLSKS